MYNAKRITFCFTYIRNDRYLLKLHNVTMYATWLYTIKRTFNYVMYIIVELLINVLMNSYLVGVTAVVAVHSLLQVFMTIRMLLKRCCVISSRNHAWVLFAGDQVITN